MADQIGADRIDLTKPAAGRAAAMGRMAADYLTLTKPPSSPCSWSQPSAGCFWPPKEFHPLSPCCWSAPEGLWGPAGPTPSIITWTKTSTP